MQYRKTYLLIKIATEKIEKKKETTFGQDMRHLSSKVRNAPAWALGLGSIGALGSAYLLGRYLRKKEEEQEEQQF